MATRKRRAGRPSAYRRAFDRAAYHLCLLGATDAELASAFGVTDKTIGAWKKAYPGFVRSLNAGKAQADANVASRLYARAMGYEHKAVKIFADPKSGAEKIVEYTERYAPDTTACIFWLKNRSDHWRDRHEHTGKDGAALIPPPVAVDLSKLSTQQLAELAALTALATTAGPEGA